MIVKTLMGSVFVLLDVSLFCFFGYYPVARVSFVLFKRRWIMLRTDPWIIGLVVVSFDDEKGPVIDFASPSAFLTPKLENDIKWISLPRETNHVHDDCFFVFRLRSDREIPYFESSFQNHDYCYGYVYFQ